jgi:Collagen triple helix repeat (20 copies)
MAGPAKLVVKVDVDSTQASQELDRAAGKINAFSKIASAALAFKIAGEAVDGIKQVVAAASDLSETVAAGQVIFGAGFAKVTEFANNSARALGQSRRQAIDAASTFATFGKAAGLSGDNLAKFAIDLTGLASDLASFKNTSPEAAITAIGAALRGEMEPIRAYGVILDDATLRQVALKNGIIATTKNALTPAQKVLAANLAIWEQTKDAQGDFARTSEGLANQQRILNAVWEDMQAELGVALMPLFLQLGRILLDKVVPAVQAVIDVAVLFIRALSGEDIDPASIERDWAEPFVNAGKTIHDAVLKVAGVLKTFWDEHGEQIINAGKAIKDFAETFVAKVGEVVNFVNDHKDVFKPLTDAITTIADKAGPAAESLKTLFDKFKDVVVPTGLETIGNVIDEIEKIPDKLRPSVAAVNTELGKMEGPLKDLKAALDPFVKPIKELAEDHLPQLAFGLGLVLSPLPTLVSTFLILWHNSEEFRTSIKNVAEFIIEKLPPAIALVGGFAREFSAALTDLIIKLQPVIDTFKNDWPIIEQRLREFKDAAQPIIDNLLPILAVAGTLFLAMVAPMLIVAGTLVFLWAHFETFRNVVNSVIGFIVNYLFGGLLRKMEDVIAGAAVMTSIVLFLWGGMRDGITRAVQTIQGVISDIFDPIIGSMQTAYWFVVGLWESLQRFIGEKARAIGGIIGGLFSGLPDAFRTAWNDVVSLWNRITIPSIKLFAGSPFEQNLGGGGGLPGLPRLAAGGIVNRPTVALIGERGPEAVIPLSRMTPTTTINVNIDHAGLAIDSPKLQRDLVGALQRYTAREGSFATARAVGAAGTPGPAGPPGETGPMGPSGDTGPAGPKGDTGTAGPAGSTGATGAQGPKGDTGTAGATGAQGVKGDTGATGPKGDTGSQGIPGATGSQGPKGDTGTAGATGPAGPGLPTGGTTGQQAVKSTNADFAVAWSTERFKWG